MIKLVFLMLSANLASPPALQEYQLGMTIEEARNVNPKTDEDAAFLSCSTDENPSRFMIIGPDRDISNIQLCWIVSDQSWGKSREGLKLSSEINATVSLWFFNGMLYEIESFSDFADAGGLSDALNSKYGKPDEDLDVTYSNGFGRKTDGKILKWLFPKYNIVFKAPDLNNKRMSITYTDLLARNSVENLVKDRNESEIDL